MASLRSRRLAKVEAALAGLTAAPVPSVLRVGIGMTRREAWDRFRTKHPALPPRHTGNFLVVPEKVSTPEQHVDFERRFKKQQMEIVRAVKRSYSDAAEETPITNAVNSAPRLSKRQSMMKRWTPKTR